MRKRTKKSVRKSIDRLWSLCIRARDPMCCKCGKPTRDAHHLFGRKNLSTRWDLRNGIGLCAYCHVFDKQGFEQSPYITENMNVIYDKFGLETVKEIERITYQIKKYTLDDYLNLEIELKKKLELLS